MQAQAGPTNMATHRLIITIPLEAAEDRDAVELAHNILEKLHYLHELRGEARVAVSLVRSGDRAALNILLPKIKGRVGELHHPARPALLEELDILPD